MDFELWQLFLAGVGYLLILFLIAYAAEEGWLPGGIARHPLTYTLSLGVYATSWTFYGSVGFAQHQGYLFLTIYLGVTLAFLLGPVLLQPILRLTREYQLGSVADLFTFRYRSQLAGILVTLFMLAGTLPYIALQIRAVTESLRVLTQEAAPNVLALVFCITLILFAILFGARHSSARERHEGLVVAIAFESLVKLAALMAVGLFAVFGTFGGLGGLNDWLVRHPEAITALYAPVREGPWATLLFLSFCAAFLLPRQFHMAFTENLSERALSVATWGFPLYLLLLNLAVPPILWAGTAQAVGTGADYYPLGIALLSGNALLPTVVYLGGISAASAMMIVTSLSLSSMCLNHLLLPASYPDPAVDLYRWVLWGRRIIIAIIIMLGYGFYLLLERNQGLVQLGLISFVAVAQFLPGIVGLLYWRRATRFGFVAGLAGGALIWTLTLLVPLLHGSGIIENSYDLHAALALPGQGMWDFATFLSLTVNSLLFVGVSLFTRPTPAEREAAQACCRESVALPPGVVTATSPAQFQDQLALIIGKAPAAREVRQSLHDLGMSPEESRPSELRRLRERIERNLSGLMGPLLARVVVDERLQMDPEARTALADSLRFSEQRLEESRTRLRGLAAELDTLRRYHRQVLRDLPLAVCSIGLEKEVVSWNLAMTDLSGLPEKTVVGTPLRALPQPWSGLLDGFAGNPERHQRKVHVQVDERTRVFNLHKSSIEDPSPSVTPRSTDRAAGGGTVILVEDLTDLHSLEAKLAHSERLASVGRLAAGVAHEVGNPVTGIACLAQNLLTERDELLTEEGLHQILEQTRRISNIVHSLVSFSHSGSPEEEAAVPVSLRHCVGEAVRLMRLTHEGKQLEFRNRCRPGDTVYGNAQQLIQVFVNLLSNASAASRPGDQVEITGVIDGECIKVEVRDHGAGIPPESIDRVFEPFFTTKQPGEGTGLGLALVYSIVQSLDGTVAVRSRPGEGACFTLRLPYAGDPTRTDVKEEARP